MITTGIVKQINISSGSFKNNKYVVELTVFKVPGDENINNYTFEANCSVIGGLSSPLKVGDKVYVGFLNNNITYPFIIGTIYTGISDEARGKLNLQELKVTDSVELPPDTKIGDLTYNYIKNTLKPVIANPEGNANTELKKVQIGDTIYSIPEGGSGEPEEYLKSASVSGGTLTLTKKDDNTVTFSPVAFNPMKSAWSAGGQTTLQAAQKILTDADTANGQAYLATVYWSDLPSSTSGQAMTQVEVRAYVISKSAGIVLFEANSADREPYNWSYNSYSSGRRWIALGGSAGTEVTTLLASDLYTYTNIGMITGASQTSPKLVAEAGDSLKDVFNAILGTQQDVQPTISVTDTKITEAQTGHTSGGGEVGASVSASNGTFKITLSNSGTTNYGYKIGDTKYTGSQTFYYPIQKQNSADVEITLPTGKTSSDVTITTGSLVSSSGNKLYCNFTNKVLLITIPLASDTVGTSAKTRFNKIDYKVKFDAARKTENDSSTTLTAFLTYLGNDATDQSKLSHAEITGQSDNAWTISAGSYYTYVKTTNDTTHVSTGWTRYGSGTTSVTDLVLTANAGQYIWIASTSSYNNLYEWNDVSGKYNTDTTAMTKVANQTIHTNTGLDVTTYYTYRTTNARSGATNKKFKLTT